MESIQWPTGVFRPVALAEMLKKRCRAKDWPSEGLMPPVRVLAAEYGVSPPTVLKALNLLCKGGLLEQSRRDGRYCLFGFGGVSTRAEQAVTGPRYKRVARMLRRDLIDGTYTAFLPLAKQLRVRYGCSHVTLRKVLHELESDGLLHEEKGRWHAAQARSTSPGSRVYLTGGSSLLRAYHHQLLGLISGLERELQRQGWGEPGLYCTDQPVWKNAPKPHQISGFVHVILGADKPWLGFHKRREEIPLVVIDPTESIRGKFRQRVLFRLVPDNRRAGMEMGNHLRALGHERIVLICHLPKDIPWVRLRAQGLAEAFGMETPDAEGPVKWVGMDVFNGIVHPAADQVLNSREDVSGRLADLWRLFTIPDLLPEDVVREGLQPVYRLRDQLGLAFRSVPLFERIFEDGSRTAWVCVNDELAIVANKFLHDRALRPGRDIALGAFDNSPFSYHLGITSYDFQLDRFGPEAVRCLQYPAMLSREGTTRVIPGQLVQRDSTRGS